MGIVRRKVRPLLWGSAGAAVAYLWDPDRGRGRRARLKDQVQAALRRRGRDLGRKAQYIEGQAQGVVARANPLAGSGKVLDDKVVVDKVRSEVLGTEEFNGLEVLVDAADGVVTLRGEVADEALTRKLEAAVGAVSGVKRVENLLHPPGTDAPNKQAAREAS